MERCVYVTIGGKEYPMCFSLGSAKRIGEKFGGFKKMQSLMSDKTDDLKKLDAFFDILEILIAQGCAYKNAFESTLPYPERAPVKDGKYVPISKEMMELVVTPDEAQDFAEKIKMCMENGSKKTVALKIDAKNV